VIAGDGGLGTAEHLAEDPIGQVVPESEQHRDDRCGQRQHVRAPDRRLLPLIADDLADPADQVGEPAGRES
jgi:hypothetical protein